MPRANVEPFPLSVSQWNFRLTWQLWNVVAKSYMWKGNNIIKQTKKKSWSRPDFRMSIHQCNYRYLCNLKIPLIFLHGMRMIKWTSIAKSWWQNPVVHPITIKCNKFFTEIKVKIGLHETYFTELLKKLIYNNHVLTLYLKKKS